ncbi:DnaJ C-terminal domain-containing protein [Streptomyces sp. NBC_00005]|uniref:DnaJ C-terminal domain-containing protein n=1 Tax=Streptomyces sp. NBC_00005 TaxID=2903609 RepID=UPI00324E42C6
MGNGSSRAVRHAVVAVGSLVFTLGAVAPLVVRRSAGMWFLGGVGMLVGTALVVGARVLDSRDARLRQPRSVDAVVRLTSDQALRGVTARVPLTARPLCPGCGGGGRRRRRACWRCLGTGLGAVGRLTREIKVPAGVRHGATLTVPGSGAPGGRGRSDGDLRLSFRVGNEGTPPHDREPHLPDRPRPTPQRTPYRSEAQPPSGNPVTVRTRKRDTEFTVAASGIVVRDEMRSHTGARWRTRLALRWEEIADLGFDYGSHDSVVSLWAVCTDGSPRRPVADARALTGAQWEELALAARALSNGRIRIDLTRLDATGILRDT